MASTSFRGASLPPSSSLPSTSSSSTPSTSTYPAFNGGSGAPHHHHHHHDRSTSSHVVNGNGHLSRPSMADRSFTAFAGTSSSSLHGANTSLVSSSSSSSASYSHNGNGSNGIDLPVAAMNSAANRSANAAGGLYQMCIALLKRLRRVPGFAERYLDTAPDASAPSSSNNTPDNSNSDLSSPLSPTTPSIPSSTLSLLPTDTSDPVSQVVQTLRLGASLCYIFNMTRPEKRLDVNPDASLTSNYKACQRASAHFVMACSTQLGWNDEDMFRVGELYSQDTNGTVKVVNNVTKLLNLIEERGGLLPPQEDEDDIDSIHTIVNGDTKSLGARGNVVKEILTTERKYVQDLEVLQEYSRKLSDEQLLSQDTIHGLFLNLNNIVDFARRFLIGVETNACLPPEAQRFGSLFSLMEESFSVYEPYCVNYPAAAELLQVVMKTDAHILAKVAHILDINELLMFHIKPVQRLLKYHLLFDTLAKATDPSWPYYQELVDGVETAKRIADKVNEEKRKQENRQAAEELRGLVEDWKGHELSSFGDLLLHETFSVLKSEVEREYHVYLFQKIILCCKDSPVQNGKTKVNKSNSMIRKSNSSAPLPARRRPTLQLKGRIFINNVLSAKPFTNPGSYLLEIKWRGDQVDEAFSIKCRTPDQLNQWTKAVNKAVEEMIAQRRSRSVGQLRRLASPHSQFPNTPQSEMGPMVPGFGGSSASLNSAMGYGQNPYGGTFDDEGDDGYSGEYEGSTGRSSSSLGMQRRGVATQSMPPGSRQNADSFGASNSSRPRAQTEDSNSAVINQWRSQTPSGGYPSVPSLPGQLSAFSSTNGGSPSEGPPSLRHSASKSALRKKQSHEWPNPLPSASGSSANSSSAAYSPAVNSLRGQSINQQMDEMSLHGNEPLRMLRQNSQGNMPIHNAPPPLRSRSASSPHVYQLAPGQLQAGGPNDKQWSPYPMDNVHPSHFAPVQVARQLSNGQGAMPLKRNMAGNSSTVTIASTAGSSTTAPPKRFSSCSTGTDRSSEDSGQSVSLPYTSPTSSISTTANGTISHYSRESQSTPQPSVNPPQTPLSPSSAIKVKVNYGEDTFVIVVLATITYQELSKKVVHKIHLCGARTNGLDASTLRLKYEDEEGDKILMTADDDVAMAFDWLRSCGNPHASLIVYAE
ncbi:hypothetical protein P389DRAFT_181959 [Cystobasidium minutum MCA 4210]|uniref:uncharacterized protein n=1 Tax=Cystobasidium minutum MCA 4210 TaxID=1397322 RepID=UPI0034CD1EA7|eukprot:jgi/Rhomi1/181959/fgenesh1_pg.9_\